MIIGSYTKDQVGEILKYDRKELFKDPPTFNCAPIVFELTREPGWTIVARAVLEDERSVNLVK